MALTKVIGNGLGTLGDGTANDTKIVFDGNAQDFHVGLDDSTDSLTIGLGSTLGTTSHIVIDANGHITKPLQSSFQAKVQNGGQASFTYNAAQTIIFSREVFDQNADFDTSTYTFTAPVTGKYQLQLNVLVTYLDYNAGYYQTYLQTSNQFYYCTIDPDMGGKDFTYFNLNSNVVADMDANDTAICKILQSGGTSGHSNLDSSGTFSGMLIG